MFLQAIGLLKFLRPSGLVQFWQGSGLGLLRNEVGLGTFFEKFCSTNVSNNTNVL